MSVYAPDTDLRLIKSPLTYGDGHQLDFANAAAQAVYFQNLPGVSYTDFTYQRKDRTIRIADIAENLYQYNYVMYRNKTSAKWFYAFIEKIEFVNQNCTHVVIKTDVFQTWMFDFSFKMCRVIREHTPTDGAYEHSLPEPIDAGEAFEIDRQRATPYSMSGTTDTEFENNYRVIICCSEAWGNTEIVSNMYGGTPKTVYYYGFNRAQVRAAIHSIVQANGADSIVAVYTVPIGAVNWNEVTAGYDGVAPYYLPYDKASQTVTKTMPTGNSITTGGVTYTFRNKKCLSYPFHYYRLWSANGTAIDLKPQDIWLPAVHGMSVRSTFSGTVCPSLLVVPEYYRYNGEGVQSQTGSAFRNGASFTDLPQIAVKTSVYENFIAMNQSALTVSKLQIAEGVISGAIGLLGNNTGVSYGLRKSEPGLVANGGVHYATNPAKVDVISESANISGKGVSGALGAAVSGAMSAFGLAAQMCDMQRQPDHVKGTPQGNAVLMSGGAGVFLSEMLIKPEYLTMIDSYFTMYGYYVNAMKTPQFKSRKNHNYIETLACNLEGDMPQDDADELCAMFNSGLTVWHNPAYFGDYTRDNSPVTP